MSPWAVYYRRRLFDPRHHGSSSDDDTTEDITVVRQTAILLLFLDRVDASRSAIACVSWPDDREIEGSNPIRSAKQVV